VQATPRLAARSFADAEIDEGADRADIYDVPNIDDARKAIRASGVRVYYVFVATSSWPMG
jgi:hypothetical protein